MKSYILHYENYNKLAYFFQVFSLITLYVNIYVYINYNFNDVFISYLIL